MMYFKLHDFAPVGWRKYLPPLRLFWELVAALPLARMHLALPTGVTIDPTSRQKCMKASQRRSTPEQPL
jgi:hypothetical protein